MLTRLLRLVAVAAVIMTVTVMSGCTAPTGNETTVPIKAEDVNIEQSQWTLVGINGQPVPSGVGAPTMAFEPKNARVAGHGGCNRYFAAYTLDGHTLSAGPIGSTKKMCEPAAMAIEASFFAALGQPNDFSMENGQLSLKTASGTELRFELAD